MAVVLDSQRLGYAKGIPGMPSGQQLQAGRGTLPRLEQMVCLGKILLRGNECHSVRFNYAATRESAPVFPLM